MVSNVKSNLSETRINVGLAIKYHFEDEWLDSLDEPMCVSVDGGPGLSASSVTLRRSRHHCRLGFRWLLTHNRNMRVSF